MTPAILLYRGRGVISTAIKWRTWGCYSHAALLTSRGTVIEAWHFGGVREVPFQPSDSVDAFQVLGATEETWRQVEDFMRSQVGKPYDFLGIIRFLFRLDSANEAWFCSELVAEAFALAGIPLLNREAHRISPACIGSSPLMIKVESNQHRRPTRA